MRRIALAALCAALTGPAWARIDLTTPVGLCYVYGCTETITFRRDGTGRYDSAHWPSSDTRNHYEMTWTQSGAYVSFVPRGFRNVFGFRHTTDHGRDTLKKEPGNAPYVACGSATAPGPGTTDAPR